MTSKAIDIEDRKVRDMMTSGVRTISRNSTMGEAAKMFVTLGVSGLPVVDEMGKCVGVLSTYDLVKRWFNNSTVDHFEANEVEFEIIHEGQNRPQHIEQVPEDRVARHMSTAVQTIAPDKSAIDAANYMSAEDIHHLVVVDEGARPIGVVSTLDVLKVLVTIEK